MLFLLIRLATRPCADQLAAVPNAHGRQDPTLGFLVHDRIMATPLPLNHQIWLFVVTPPPQPLQFELFYIF